MISGGDGLLIWTAIRLCVDAIMDGDVSTGSKVAVTIAVSWLGWYTWKFLIFPLVYRDASRELPHFIPCKQPLAD